MKKKPVPQPRRGNGGPVIPTTGVSSTKKIIGFTEYLWVTRNIAESGSVRTIYNYRVPADVLPKILAKGATEL